MAVGVLLVLGGRVLYLVARWVLGTAQHFQVESAAIWFLGVGVATVLASVPVDEEAGSGGASRRLSLWFAFCAGAVVLYARSFQIGFLSEDFGLAGVASAWHLKMLSPEFFRPVPLLAWGVLIHAGASPWVFHLLNVVLHGTNAYLLSRVAGAWTRYRWLPALAGVLFLLLPVAPEAVAWCSGVFDVSATTVILLSILWVRRVSRHPSFWRIAAAVGLCIVAVLCKETAIVLPAVCALDALVRRDRSRGLLITLIAISLLFAAFAVVRLRSVSGPAAPITQYVVRRFVFSLFGTLATPWHVLAFHALPALVIAGASIVLGLLLGFFAGADRASLRAPVSSAAWVVIAALPIAPVLYVLPDLEASRYLYLPGCGWALLLVSLADVTIARWESARVSVIAALGGLAILSAVAVLTNLTPWVAAGRARRSIEAAAIAELSTRPCMPTSVTGLPDSIDGAYIFRNSALEDFASIAKSVVGSHAVPCSLVWDASEGRMRRVGGS